MGKGKRGEGSAREFVTVRGGVGAGYSVMMMTSLHEMREERTKRS